MARPSLTRPVVSGYPAGEYTVSLSPKMSLQVAHRHAANQLQRAGAPIMTTAHFSYRLGVWMNDGQPLRDAINRAALESLVGVIWQ